MSVITIARELGALGDEIAKDLAERTKYRLIDRTYLDPKLAERGLTPDKTAKYDEKKPGFWAALSQERDDYVHYLKLVLYEEASKGDAIILGRGSSALFRGIAGTVSVRVVAPLVVRKRRVMEYSMCDEHHALKMIERNDRDRLGFHKYFFDFDWTDSSSFSLTINTETLGAGDASKLICDYMDKFVTRDAEKAGLARFSELLLGQEIADEIVYKQHVPIHFLEVEIKDKTAILHGIANTIRAQTEAEDAAKNVKGVDSIVNGIQIVQEFSIMP